MNDSLETKTAINRFFVINKLFPRYNFYFVKLPSLLMSKEFLCYIIILPILRYRKPIRTDTSEAPQLSQVFLNPQVN